MEAHGLVMLEDLIMTNPIYIKYKNNWIKYIINNIWLLINIHIKIYIYILYYIYIIKLYVYEIIDIYMMKILIMSWILL